MYIRQPFFPTCDRHLQFNRIFHPDYSCRKSFQVSLCQCILTRVQCRQRPPRRQRAARRAARRPALTLDKRIRVISLIRSAARSYSASHYLETNIAQQEEYDCALRPESARPKAPVFHGSYPSPRGPQPDNTGWRPCPRPA